MTVELMFNILWWFGMIAGIAILTGLVFGLVMFLIACGLYVIPWLQSKIDLKTIVSEKYQNRIYLDEAQYIIANDELQAKINERMAKVDELDSDIRKLAAKRKSLEAELESPKKGVKK